MISGDTVTRGVAESDDDATGEGDTVTSSGDVAVRWDRRGEIGARGEELAAQFLSSRGCRILDRNWRHRAGELDLIVRDTRGTVRFVEVRTRTGAGFGSPAESITAAKLVRLRRLATLWLGEHPQDGCRVTFDVVGVDLSDRGRPRLELFEDVI